MEESLGAYLSGQFNGGRPLAANESLFMSGLIDSLGIQQLALFISETYGVELSPLTIVEEDLDSIEEITRRIRQCQA